jgi:hypothetical protein
MTSQRAADLEMLDNLLAHNDLAPQEREKLDELREELHADKKRKMPGQSREYVKKSLIRAHERAVAKEAAKHANEAAAAERRSKALDLGPLPLTPPGRGPIKYRESYWK